MIATNDEEDRLSTLRSYRVLDSAPERGYDDITELAAFVCGTPISLISFVDEDRQWFKSAYGLDSRETPRSRGFCAHIVDHGGTLVVEDASQDERFRTNPLVVGEPNIRFYAGAPIVGKTGHVLGTVCVMDTEPRVLTARQISALEALARQVVVLLEQGDAIATLEKAADASRDAERQVLDSEQRLRAFVDGFPALAWMADRDGWIYWYNRRWYEYTGSTPQQMEGWGWQSVHDPEMLPAVMERWTACIRTGDPFEMVFPLKGSDGEFRPFLTRIEPLRDKGGNITQWFGTNTEVDALHKTQLALEKSQAGLNQVLTATKDAIVSVNHDWTLSYMNPMAERLYGPSDRLVGRNFWEAFPDAASTGSPFLEPCTRAMEEGVAASFEAKYGEPLHYTLSVEVYPSKDGIVTFSRDITKLKHAAAMVLQNEKLAAVGRLASSIAHEINNPLEAVTNLLYLARSSASLEESMPYLNSADVELRRACTITKQTLRFHRQTSRPMFVTFADLVKDIFMGQHSRLTNSGATVQERDRSARSVLCREGEIRQLLSNFISNAIDAMHLRGGTLFVRGRDGRNWKTGETGMVLTIADTGVGMSEATRSKVFEPFYTTKGIGGIGLGLWISKGIVDRHEGILRIKSRQGSSSSGTVLTLFLPTNGAERGEA